MLNEVDTNALYEARSVIAASPESGIVHYGVQLDWETGVRAHVRALPITMGAEVIERDHTWVVDEPPQLLGNSEGPTPQEFLMSGVGSCIMVGFIVNASLKGIEVRDLRITVRGALDLAGFMGIRDDARVEMEGLEYEITVDADASPELLEEVREAAVEFSPNAMTVRRGVPVTGTVKQLQQQ